MGAKAAVHTFKGGMVKDLDKSLVTSDRYLDAHNIRLITGAGESTGALENVEGNNNVNTLIGPSTVTNGHVYVVVKGSATYNNVVYTLGQSFTALASPTTFTGSGSLVVDAYEFMDSGMRVAGSVYIRDTVVLFLTDQTTATPTSGHNKIVKFGVNKATETLTNFTVLYDDALNNSMGCLNFSVANPISAEGMYEAPDIQKIYWADGYNNMRYANIAAYLTTDGLVKSGTNYYFSPDLFEFIPKATLTKPTLNHISSGAIHAGMVQYAFQYFINHGAESMISPPSNIIHITEENDYATNDILYKGAVDSSSSAGKSVRMDFSTPDYTKFTHIRIIRLHYSTVNSVPTIKVVAEIPVDSATVSYLDSGANVIGTLTLDEYNIGETELFSAGDITVKNNRLFAANINKDEFTLDDWDARAVRFKKWSDTAGGTDVAGPKTSTESDTTMSRLSDTSMSIVITGFKSYTGIPSARTLATSAVTSITSALSAGNVVSGVWTDTLGGYHSFSATLAQLTITVDSYTTGSGGVLTFHMFTSGTPYFYAAGKTFSSIYHCSISSMEYTYNYTTSATDYIQADVYNDVDKLSIYQPATDNLAGWNAAGWSGYSVTHDGICDFNDPANDGVAAHRYVFQSDGTTLGAEGLNVKIGFTTLSRVIDNGSSGESYTTGLDSSSYNKSYTGYSSPCLSGYRSWQRDEVYRLYLVFFDSRGRSSSAKWVCDLRMPSLHDSGYEVLASKSGSLTSTTSLYPNIILKSLPTNAVSAQLLRVERGGADRSILTQALVIPLDTGATTFPKNPDVIVNNLDTIKLVSPEINITNNVSKGSSDYLEYVTHFTTTGAFTDYPSANHIYFYKLRESNLVAYGDNCKATVIDTVRQAPRVAADTFSFAAKTCTNYNATVSGLGCSGLFVQHNNAVSWTPIGTYYAVVNYKRDVHASQYGGQYFEDREGNIAIPASDIITLTNSQYDAWSGDTFINWFDVSTTLFDLTQTTNASKNETVYVPLESSINSDLRSDMCMHRAFANDFGAISALMQEVAGKWTNASGTIYNQPTSLYQYNTVYSQDATAMYYINVPASVSTQTQFDCMIRASKPKINGELLDSWTLFPVDEFIEVNSSNGAVNVLECINNRMLFWQDTAFGQLSVNERALVQDFSGAALVLGTGGVLDRYDYITDDIGCMSPQHMISALGGVYWINTRDKCAYRFTDKLENLSKARQIQSWFNSQLSALTVNYNVIRTGYDKKYNEVLFSFYNTNTALGTTLVFNESIDSFTSFYDYYTYRFIPFIEGFLSTSHLSYGTDFLFYHNSQLKDRACFYSYIPYGGADETTSSSPKYVNSTIKLVFNDDYEYSKVFDNISFVSTVTVNDVEVYNNTFSNIRCYNNYQNSDTYTLTYGNTTSAGVLALQRDEREWTTVVPRNSVNKNYSTNPDIFSSSNLDNTRKFRERMRDKYMITDFTYTNTSNRRFVCPLIAIKYRASYR